MEDNPVKMEDDLQGPIEQYISMRRTFQSILSDEESKLHHLGDVVWEANFNPEEMYHQVGPQPVKNPIHRKINALLPKVYGVPIYCYHTNQSVGRSSLMVKGNDNEWCSMGTVQNLNISLLKKLAKPSPFGDLDKMETVYDNTVRDALEITEFKFGTDSKPSEDLPDFFKSILGHIKRSWKIQNIHLVPQKINIYQKGGFFKPHTDTPTNPGRTLGSLVVYLPSKFTGGEFVVTHNNQKNSLHEFNKRSNQMYYLKWIAFYSDCIHEVLPVKTGTRITLTLSIDVNDNIDEEPNNNNKQQHAREDDKEYSDEEEDEEIEEEEDEEKDKYTQVATGPLAANPVEKQRALNDLVEALEVAKEPSVGFVLDHKYTHSALDLGILKGSDRDLMEKLRSEGYSFELQSVLYKTHVTVAQSDWTHSSSTKSVYSWTKEDMNWILGKGPKPKHSSKYIPFFRVGALGDALDSESILGAEHTGNECRDSEFQTLYWNAALIAHKPTWWTRTRLLWIAWKKNTPQECVVAKLPAEIIKYIADFLPGRRTPRYKHSVGDYVEVMKDEEIYEVKILATKDGKYLVELEEKETKWIEESEIKEYVSEEEELDSSESLDDEDDLEEDNIDEDDAPPSKKPMLTKNTK